PTPIVLTRPAQIGCLSADENVIDSRAALLSPSRSFCFDADRLGPLSQHRSAQFRESIEIGCDSNEMIACKLAHLARKSHAPIGDQDLGLADPAGIEKHLARRRVARVVLVGQPEILLAKRNPNRLPAPAHM